MSVLTNFIKGDDDETKEGEEKNSTIDKIKNWASSFLGNSDDKD